MNKFESVRIYKEEIKTKSMYQSKYRIEFVVKNNKRQQFLTRVFGSLYNVGTSRYNDGLMVYRPQEYRDFLILLADIKYLSKEFNVYIMEQGFQSILPNNRVTFYDPTPLKDGLNKLIIFASNYYADANLTYKEQEIEKLKFINKCNEILNSIEQDSIMVKSN